MPPLNPATWRREYRAPDYRSPGPQRKFLAFIEDLRQRAVKTVGAAFVRLRTAGFHLSQEHSLRDKFSTIIEELRTRARGRIRHALDENRARRLPRPNGNLHFADQTAHQSLAGVIKARLSQVVSAAGEWSRSHLEWAALGVAMLAGVVVITILNAPSNVESSTEHSTITTSSVQASTNDKRSLDSVAVGGSSISNATNRNVSGFLKPNESSISGNLVATKAEKQEDAPAAVKNSSSSHEAQTFASKEIIPVGSMALIHKSGLTEFHWDTSGTPPTHAVSDVGNLQQHFVACHNSEPDNALRKNKDNRSTAECGVKLPAGTKVISADTRADNGICVRFLDDTVCYWPAAGLLKPSKSVAPAANQSHQVKTRAASKATVGDRRVDDHLGFLFENEKAVASATENQKH
jgi:hypothetical protein